MGEESDLVIDNLHSALKLSDCLALAAKFCMDLVDKKTKHKSIRVCYESEAMSITVITKSGGKRILLFMDAKKKSNTSIYAQG